MCHFFAFHASKVKRDAGVECKTPSHVARVMRSTPSPHGCLLWPRKSGKMTHVQNATKLSLPLEMPATRTRQNNHTEREKSSPWHM